MSPEWPGFESRFGEYVTLNEAAVSQEGERYEKCLYIFAGTM